MDKASGVVLPGALGEQTWNSLLKGVRLSRLEALPLFTFMPLRFRVKYKEVPGRYYVHYLLSRAVITPDHKLAGLEQLFLSGRADVQNPGEPPPKVPGEDPALLFWLLVVPAILGVPLLVDTWFRSLPLSSHDCLPPVSLCLHLL